jgi:hypothetical protein
MNVYYLYGIIQLVLIPHPLYPASRRHYALPHPSFLDSSRQTDDQSQDAGHRDRLRHHTIASLAEQTCVLFDTASKSWDER